MKLKKVLAVVAAAAICAGTPGAATVQADTPQPRAVAQEKTVSAAVTDNDKISAAGICGEDAAWTLDKQTGILSISGTGEANMDFSADYDSERLFGKLKKYIRTIKVAQGITGLAADMSASLAGLPVLTGVSLPSTLTEIGTGVFSGCQMLTELEIPAGVTKLGNSVCEGCGALTKVTFHEGLKRLGAHAFSGCESLKSLIIPQGVTVIDDYAFNGCVGLEEIKLPSTLEKLGTCFTQTAYADRADNWENGGLYINGSLAGVKQDASGVFEVREGTLLCATGVLAGKSGITGLKLPSTLKSVEKLFTGSFLKELEVSPDNPYFSAQESVLYNRDKTRLLHCLDVYEEFCIPDCVTSIETGAFEDCAAMQKLVIPDTVKQVGCSLCGFTPRKKLVVYCEAAGALAGWDKEWRSDGMTDWVNVVYRYDAGRPVTSVKFGRCSNKMSAAENAYAKKTYLYPDVNYKTAGDGVVKWYSTNKSVFRVAGVAAGSGRICLKGNRAGSAYLVAKNSAGAEIARKKITVYR